MREQPALQRLARNHEFRHGLEVATRLLVVPARGTLRKRLQESNAAPSAGVAHHAARISGPLLEKDRLDLPDLKNSKSSEGTLDEEGGCWAKNAATTQKAIGIIASSCSGILTPVPTGPGVLFGWAGLTLLDAGDQTGSPGDDFRLMRLKLLVGPCPIDPQRDRGTR